MAARVVLTGSLLATNVVAGNPFVAHFERRTVEMAVGESSERSAGGIIFVDRLGRARIDFGSAQDEGPNGRPSLASIWDPVRRAAWIVDNTSNRALMEVPAFPALGINEAAASGESMTTRVAVSEASVPLGARTIEGLACEGLRTEIHGPEGRIVVETWRSTELGHVLLETQQRASERITYRLYDIRRVDPDPALFTPRRDEDGRLSGLATRIASRLRGLIRRATR